MFPEAADSFDAPSMMGAQRVLADVVAANRVAAWNGLFDVDGDAPQDGDPVPVGFHWTVAQPTVPESKLAGDGQPVDDGLLPPAPLPCRLWAGSRVLFQQPLRVGECVRRRSRVVGCTEKQGRTGRLVFVHVHHEIVGREGVAVEEHQEMVFRARVPIVAAPSATREHPVETWSREIRATETLLFRFSALTSNSHRIHYDRPYAMDVEGYPGLVVQGPLIASLLLKLLADQRPDVTVERFDFVVQRPTFDRGPFTLHGHATPDERRFRLWSTNDRGEHASEADVWVR